MDRIKKWRSLGLGMFIHFGVYSAFGGMYKGKRVEAGYSEQIMQFARIPREEYIEAANAMELENFSAGEIVSLAKTAGFSYILFTAKHHDGFCMYDTRTTDFNIVKQTAFGKDIVALLADECRKQGLGFAVYFSLIDWNLGHDYDPNNLNEISTDIEEVLCEQLLELLTGYGDICELWFDMSSPTLRQSLRFKELVRKYQPDAMINGRLGNGEGDFVTFWDNEVPERPPASDVAWQTPQSIYPDTWGYREWQKRGDAAERAEVLARNYRYVRERGGNYLLNIGPRGDGSIDPFERKVLEIFGGEAADYTGSPDDKNSKKEEMRKRN